MAIPETDVARIQRWARAQVPEHLRGELRVEADVSPRHVDVVEVRPPWDGVGDHTRFPVARLRFTKYSGLWTLYWRDRNLKFHLYEDAEPTPRVQELLDLLDEGADPIFWG